MVTSGATVMDGGRRKMMVMERKPWRGWCWRAERDGGGRRKMV